MEKRFNNNENNIDDVSSSSSTQDEYILGKGFSINENLFENTAISKKNSKKRKGNSVVIMHSFGYCISSFLMV